MTMLKSYFVVGARQLLAQRLYSVINILGLAVGLACAIIIFLFVSHELRFDERFEDADRIYRISGEYHEEDGRAALYPAPNVQSAAPQLKLDFAAEIEESARIWGQRVRLRQGADVFYENNFRWADASFFDIFKLDWIAGDPGRALAEPSTVVLTESAARKYFGDENPLGQTLLLENEWPITVTGVVRDLPTDTHLSASAIASFDSGLSVLGWNYEGNWSFWNFHTYVRLRPGARIESIESRFADFVERHRRLGDGLSSMSATKLTDIHLNGRVAELTPPGSMTNVLAFSVVALAILLIACVNFMNLATARAAQRSREVGMRKALGASRVQLVAQFLGEAIVYAGVAMLLAVALVEVLLQPFNAFAGTALAFDYFGDGRMLVGLAAFALVVGVAAGSYPSFYLAAFEPAKVLKGDATRGASGARLRSALVIVQFAISIVLLIVTATIYSQTEFARNVERGFETEQIVRLAASPTEDLGARFAALRNRLLGHPEITHVIRGSMQPGDAGYRRIRAEGGDPAGREMPSRGVDFGFFEAYGIELLAGRTFAEDRGTDTFVIPPGRGSQSTGSYVLNALAARELGWTAEQAIGKWLETDFSFDFSTSVRGPIIGVVRNTYIDSVREPVKPLIYFASAPTYVYSSQPYFTDASVRVTGKRLAETLAFIDAAWKEIVPDQPLARSFLNEQFAALYRNEQRQAQIFGTFSLLAVFVACLGLFGLASFTTERRTKEIGIRKTLGGSVWDVVALLTADFSKLVLLANVVAWPIALVLMQRWLADFAYRIALSPTIFIASALVAFLVAWVTVAGIGFRAASVKPVYSLRHE